MNLWKKISWNDTNILLNIIELMPGNVYWKDRNGVYRGMNANLPPSIGLTKEEMVGFCDHDFLPKEVADHVVKIDNIVFKTGQEHTAEEFFTDPKTGSTRIYLTKKTPLRNKRRRIIGLLGSSFDITDRKRQEMQLAEAKQKAEDANQAKTILLSSISHDMLTPLSVIDGAASLIEMRVNSSPEIQESFAMMRKAYGMLKGMIHRVLETARIKNSEINVQKEDIFLPKIINDVIEFEKSLLDKPVKINHHYEANEHFYTDRDCMRHILLNLVGNAVKFTEQGEVNIIVKGNEEQLKIIIEDTGIGIPDDAKERIFEPFERVVRADLSKYKGYGLGLPTVKKYVEVLGGEILLHSVVGKGSRFEVNIRA